ncbi:MBL fold metallo-hydrolase [Paenibacillus glufosinatiresistens]|uniref:MBL fold metallo-hydrolase n=1 Tax=Paenibacillus glufosinatiresistens TaxID=3070657 RepID=UPI00286E9E81|nr:MBL fold metallo-hydrolase [Paenibacillus sp. YX.27]
MQLAPGLFLLEISVSVMGGAQTIYPVLLQDSDHTVLIDTGYPGVYGSLREAIAAAGADPHRLDTILLTHQDLDHIGSLPDFLEGGSGIRVYAHELEIPHIQGERMLLKHTPEALAAAESALPSSVPEKWRRAFLHTLAHPPRGRVDQVLRGGETLPFAGGLQTVWTPGHSPGHLAFFHPGSRTLIAGDSLTVRGGALCGPDPDATPDMAAAIVSLRQYQALEPEAVICYHGGLFRGDVREAISAIVEQRPNL